uniref:Putative secreted protein n=1 Tax=Anopheles marajoara TaxID=58244 RepID=A0A2M4CE90_9DIPT
MLLVCVLCLRFSVFNLGYVVASGRCAVAQLATAAGKKGRTDSAIVVVVAVTVNNQQPTTNAIKEASPPRA